MPRKLPVISGEKMVKLLARQGFEIKRQTSSHVVVQKDWRVFFRSNAQGIKERDAYRHFEAGRYPS